MINLKSKLKGQIIELEDLLKLTSGDPFMSMSLSKKIDLLKKELDELNNNEDVIEAKVSLLFSGNAVVGSKGIKIDFLSKILKPFQELIKTETSKIKFGTVKNRGKIKDIKEAELYLTALPTGSFGVQLTQLTQNNIFTELEINQAIENVITLIEVTTKSDEDFENTIQKIPNRSLGNLKTFLKEISNENSMLQFQKLADSITISSDQIHNGFERINSTITTDENLIIKGTFRGVLLDSGKFEFTDENENKISGYFDETINEDKITELNFDYFNKRCELELKKIKRIFPSGKVKIYYTLIDIHPIEV
ncbi:MULTISPECIES: hypothetical protein [unclassified Empedobacter]|uniref:hypothetical protein n=1 Tax=Empedobacter TaxID=59734 RepID=UPI00244D68F4|nr:MULTISPECIES: hypothetical protein [unclassified Empedobacter]MDH1602311.1 hypothetical protein [Empedobacter sp. GD03739]